MTNPDNVLLAFFPLKLGDEAACGCPICCPGKQVPLILQIDAKNLKNVFHLVKVWNTIETPFSDPKYLKTQKVTFVCKLILDITKEILTNLDIRVSNDHIFLYFSVSP